MQIDELLLKTTIRIETTTKKGISTGTGFFYSFFHDDSSGKSIPVIVTNKHVVEGAILGRLQFSVRDKKGNIIEGKGYRVEIRDFETKWIMHPEADIDLCILPIASIHRELEQTPYELHYTCLTSDNIINQDEIREQLSLVEDITVVGYPDGIWDAHNNLPIVRRGITATPLQYDFQNQPKYLIDAAIYGGSSGSPVFIFNQGMFNLKGNLMAGNRMYLVGIVYAVAQHSVTGEITIVDVPAANTPISLTNIPNNLGAVIKACKLIDFEAVLLNPPPTD